MTTTDAEELVRTRRPQMFPALTGPQVARVAQKGVEQRFPVGHVLFDQGDSDLPLYLVTEGELEIVHPTCQGEELVTVHHEREFTGEISLLSGGRTFVKARARTPLRVLRVENEGLRQLLQTDSELSDIFMRAFILRRVGLIAGGQGDAVMIGSLQSAATLRVQAFLVQNNHPYRYVDVDRDPEVQEMLDHFHVAISDVPILLCRGQRVLRNPSDREVADCLGFNAPLMAEKVHDLVIVGAGPGGIAAAVYAASEGLDVLILEAEAPGGQAASSSKIENYLGFPTGITGGALMGRALTQAEKFGARLIVAQPAAAIHSEGHSVRVDLEGGGSVRARAAVIAVGVQYRKLTLPSVQMFEGVGIYYAATWMEGQRCSGEEIIVVGGGNSAGQAATFLARTSKQVHVLIRGPDLAASMSRYLIRRIEETRNITLHKKTQIVSLEGGPHLERVTWHDGASGELVTHPIRHVFTMAGAVPNTAWLRSSSLALDDKGFIRTGADLSERLLSEAGWPLARPPRLFETSLPNVFAVGDVRAESVKRVASAVGEGSVCVQLVHRALAE
jgi:thioredoxin reductase (NADPH)